MTRRISDPDDPRRCNGIANTGGQCLNLSVEDSKFCLAHGGRNNYPKEGENYLVEQFEQRVKFDCTSIDEIAILKENLMKMNAIIAAHANKIIDDASMSANGGTMIDLIIKAEKVTASLNRLEKSTGILLAKPALITWGQQIVQAVAATLEDKYEGWEEDLQDLSDTVATIIVQVRNEEE